MIDGYEDDAQLTEQDYEGVEKLFNLVEYAMTEYLVSEDKSYETLKRIVREHRRLIV